MIFSPGFLFLLQILSLLPPTLSEFIRISSHCSHSLPTPIFFSKRLSPGPSTTELHPQPLHSEAFSRPTSQPKGRITVTICAALHFHGFSHSFKGFLKKIYLLSNNHMVAHNHLRFIFFNHICESVCRCVTHECICL